MPLTKNDLGQITKIVTKTIDSANNELRNELRLEIISATSGLKLEIDDAKQELRQEMQTWRSEFFDKIDPILQEVTTKGYQN